MPSWPASKPSSTAARPTGATLSAAAAAALPLLWTVVGACASIVAAATSAGASATGATSAAATGSAAATAAGSGCGAGSGADCAAMAAGSGCGAAVSGAGAASAASPVVPSRGGSISLTSTPSLSAADSRARLTLSSHAWLTSAIMTGLLGDAGSLSYISPLAHPASG